MWASQPDVSGITRISDRGRQVAQVCPVFALTQPDFQGIVEVGVFFTAFLDFEWYLSLEHWLPLLFPNRYNS